MSARTYFVDKEGHCVKSFNSMTDWLTDSRFLDANEGGRVYMEINGGWRFYEKGGSKLTFIAKEDLPKPFQMQLLTGSV